MNEDYKCGSLIGKTIEIINMKDEPRYSGEIGTVLREDDVGQLHGTWGECAIIPQTDTFRIL